MSSLKCEERPRNNKASLSYVAGDKGHSHRYNAYSVNNRTIKFLLRCHAGRQCKCKTRSRPSHLQFNRDHVAGYRMGKAGQGKMSEMRRYQSDTRKVSHFIDA
jgi:hypothetical protein